MEIKKNPGDDKQPSAYQYTLALNGISKYFKFNFLELDRDFLI